MAARAIAAAIQPFVQALLMGCSPLCQRAWLTNILAAAGATGRSVSDDRNTAAGALLQINLPPIRKTAEPLIMFRIMLRELGGVIWIRIASTMILLRLISTCRSISGAKSRAAVQDRMMDKVVLAIVVRKTLGSNMSLAGFPISLVHLARRFCNLNVSAQAKAYFSNKSRSSNPDRSQSKTAQQVSHPAHQGVPPTIEHEAWRDIARACRRPGTDTTLCRFNRQVEASMPITKPVQLVRNHIQPADIKCWARHWHVTDEQIRLTIEKTGNSVVAVRKELAIDAPEIVSL
jgi:Protein of unknown function (DUF3606)